MTAEEFNALPLEARRYIEKQKTCLSCGRANDLDAHYKNYLMEKQKQLFTLRTGAISFKRKEGGKSGVLYPIHPNDSEEQVKDKLRLALELNEVAPEKFSVISVSEISAILGEETKQVIGEGDPAFGTEGITLRKTAEEADEEIRKANADLDAEGEDAEGEDAEGEATKPEKKLYGAALAAANKKALEEAKALE